MTILGGGFAAANRSGGSGYNRSPTPAFGGVQQLEILTPDKFGWKVHSA